MTNVKGRQFLSSLLRSFGELAAKNPTGRILAYCYAHALMTEPSLASNIFDKGYNKSDNFDPKQWVAEADKYPFVGPKTKRNRRADLRLVYKNKTVALAEIKVEDQDENDRDDLACTRFG
jgi:hypothetical protein